MIETTQCCGVREIVGISNFNRENSVKKILEEMFYRNKPVCGILTFTYDTAQEYGDDFIEYINENELGEIITSPDFENPNTGNTLMLGIWIPNFKNCRKLRKEFVDGKWNLYGIQKWDIIHAKKSIKTSRLYTNFLHRFNWRIVKKVEYGSAYFYSDGYIGSLSSELEHFDIIRPLKYFRKLREILCL